MFQVGCVLHVNTIENIKSITCKYGEIYKISYQLYHAHMFSVCMCNSCLLMVVCQNMLLYCVLQK
jgi:hypothetical protein